MKEFNLKYLNSEELLFFFMLNRLLFVRMNYKTKLRQPADGGGGCRLPLFKLWNHYLLYGKTTIFWLCESHRREKKSSSSLVHPSKRRLCFVAFQDKLETEQIALKKCVSTEEEKKTAPTSENSKIIVFKRNTMDWWRKGEWREI